MKVRLIHKPFIITVITIIALTVTNCCEKRADGIVMASDVYEEYDDDYIVGRVFPSSEDTANNISLMKKVALAEDVLLDNEDYIRGFDYYLKKDDEWYLSYYFRQYSFEVSENGHEIAVIQLLWVHSDKPMEEKTARENYAKEPLLMVEDGGDAVADVEIDMTKKKITLVYFHDNA